MSVGFYRGQCRFQQTGVKWGEFEVEAESKGPEATSSVVRILDISNDTASVFIKSQDVYMLQIANVNGKWAVHSIFSYSNANFVNGNDQPAFEVETEHFIISHNEAEKGCIGEILGLLESNYGRVTTNLGRELEEKTRVHVCSDNKELSEILELTDAQEWVRGGIASSGKTVISSPLNPPPGSNYYNVLFTVVHEVIHVIINEINGNIPRWLNEGIASYEAKDNSEKWIKRTIKAGLDNNTIPSLKDLDTGSDFATFFNRNGYQYSYSAAEFLVEEFGYSKLISLVKDPNNFIEVLGMTEDEFQNRWIDFLKNNYSNYSEE